MNRHSCGLIATILAVALGQSTACKPEAGSGAAKAFFPATAATELGVLDTGLKIRRAYRWLDINSAKVLTREGDTLVLDGTSPQREFSIGLTISGERLKSVSGSYGVPTNQLRFTYTDRADLERKRSELIAWAASRGLAFSKSANSFGPDYGWIIDRSQGDMAGAVAELIKVGKTAGYRDERSGLGLISSFVQAIPYKEQAATRKGDDGQEILLAGVTMPLETLANNEGDCDTKGLLFASLIKKADGPEVVFLRGGGHVFVAVQSPPRPNDRYIKLKNKEYVLIELTTAWLIGHIPGENWRGLMKKKFEVVLTYLE